MADAGNFSQKAGGRDLEGVPIVAGGQVPQMAHEGKRIQKQSFEEGSHPGRWHSLPPGDVSWPQRGGKVPIIAGGGAKSLARWQEGAPEGKNHLHRQEIICLRISRWNIAIV